MASAEQDDDLGSPGGSSPTISVSSGRSWVDI